LGGGGGWGGGGGGGGGGGSGWRPCRSTKFPVGDLTQLPSRQRAPTRSKVRASRALFAIKLGAAAGARQGGRSKGWEYAPGATIMLMSRGWERVTARKHSPSNSVGRPIAPQPDSKTRPKDAFNFKKLGFASNQSKLRGCRWTTP
jgi:hypothetical protein